MISALVSCFIGAIIASVFASPISTGVGDFIGIHSVNDFYRCFEWHDYRIFGGRRAYIVMLRRTVTSICIVDSAVLAP